MPKRDLPSVTVFSLGGTISSTADSSTEGVTSTLGAADLVDAVTQLGTCATITPVSFRNVASSDLNLYDVRELAMEIEKCLSAGADGVVVTQGTDTIEETSFALDLLLNGRGPVVVTGAMRNPTVAGADGPANLLAAIQVAASADASGMGTLVVFDDQIHTARFVRKTHTVSTATFRSPTVGPIGWIVEGQPRIALRPSALRVALEPQHREIPAVALLKSTLGDDHRLVQYLEDAGYAGLVLEGLGGGHVPSNSVASLSRLAHRIPVVLASRTGGGELLRMTYGFPGSERDLLANGLIPAGLLDGPKARILMSLLLSSGAGLDGVRTGFRSINESAISHQRKS